ncbi:hypothetical protein K504DRAFT_389813 [Pleomassaria siparia CBS 279.74]|uniref:Uncharacterized protein n=1 Tax=Pleomassaria siparia CBS 279.74 TaxID=1314801 RepID=A0A6G1JVH0_9PLEO|nr:hypothetical protein K504DRAFT_389813 [Pleomassaria siparia CBS 279.74]
MGRRGPRFSFPIPGRKSHSKVDKTTEQTHSTSSIPPVSVPEWSSHFNNPSGSYSKAERLLGTSGLAYPPSSRQTSVPPSPGYMTVTVSETSFGSESTDKKLPASVDEGSLFPTRPRTMSNRPSSTILNNAYNNGDDRRLSNCSSISKMLNPRTSNSTMRSHYDAQNSPLYISQQTSDSAVRDRALRKGKPPVATTYDRNMDDHGHVTGMLSRQPLEDIKRQSRKSKPPRLDLSRLFPKPKPSGGTTLLSPTKLVTSPSAMSTTSEYFPRPMTRVSTPETKGQAKLTKTAKRQQTSPSKPPMPTSPVRLHKREQYDGAKVNVRRPPNGIQHWFDGLGDEDGDEVSEEENCRTHALKHAVLQASQPTLSPKSSTSRLFQNSATSSQQTLRQHQPEIGSRKEQHVYGSLNHRLSSPSQFSIQSQGSLVSSKTRSSAFSKSNLQDSSVLSMSSSEDEDEDDHAPAPAPNRSSMRASIDIPDDDGDVIVGKAQAYKVRSRHHRKVPSEGKLSIMSTSTNAATIEVMYSPEAYTPNVFPPAYSSKRSSHTRQPSVIHEDEDVRPKTSGNGSLAPSSISIRSAQTSSSEPRPRTEHHKLMAVTAEEEALLEMMRRKRADMVKHNFTEGYKSAFQEDVVRQTTPPDTKAYRTSGFLISETPGTSPARTAMATSHKKVVASASPLLLPPRGRGRPIRFGQDSTLGTSVLRDSSSCDDKESERHVFTTPTSHAAFAHHRFPMSEFAPLDPTFPSSTPTASMSSPTTTDHPSPLPSPITPGLRQGESDVDVKVAGSEPSFNGDSDDAAVLDLGTLGPPSGSIKPDKSRSGINTQHYRRGRTASSGASMTFDLGPSSFPIPPKSDDLAPLAEVDSRPPSISIDSFPEPGPRIHRKSSRGINTLTLATASNPSPVTRSRMSTVSRGSSINSLTSVHSKKRDSVATSVHTRSSVSEDVLAAWGSLGGV